jgi:tRNA-2-methylthio-N6-dimethylallyladenosine synthase
MSTQTTQLTHAPTARTVYIETVGCQMNVLDSELVVGALRKHGYHLTDQLSDADVILFNTCSVREHAEEKTYSSLGRVVPFKKHNPRIVVGVIGCMAQKDQQQIRERAPYVDLVVGTGQLAKIPELVAEVQRTGQPHEALSLGRSDASRHEVEASFESYDPTRDAEMRSTPFQAFVRVQIGCDKFCTYCVVPTTRGPEQSRQPDHIVQETRQLVAQGCREITLIGQTVNSYEYTHGDGRRTRLSDLIATLHDIHGLDRIKFVTNYPKDMTADLLDVVRELPKVVKYLHVPLQSACNDVLKRMKRNYTIEEYDEMLQRSRANVPSVSISSDFIVGFCGETEASFEKTLRYVEQARFKNSFIFKYSERPGTKAADRWADDISDDVKKRRNNDLLVAQNANSLIDHRAQIGTVVSVLVEGPSRHGEREPGPLRQLTGRSMLDHIVVFDGHERMVGQIVDMTILDASAFTLFGEVLTLDAVTLTSRDPHVVRRPTRIGLL